MVELRGDSRRQEELRAFLRGQKTCDWIQEKTIGQLDCLERRDRNSQECGKQREETKRRRRQINATDKQEHNDNDCRKTREAT